MFNPKNIILFVLINTSFAVNLIEQLAPEVKISQGIVSGKISTDGFIHEYVGIPYAITNGRFQAPLPAPSWDGVYKAVDEHYQCPQLIQKTYVGTEDCLKINVYVPAFARKPLPVMVYIHGGAFLLGSGGKMLFGPDFIVKQDVILVTLNYRLGVLGFLCLGIKEAPGNAGLKDQIAALKWVKQNIAAFGGDPDNVTLFGQSAGGYSIALLLLTDATEGLFHRAIVQSGSAISFLTSDDGIGIASTVGKQLGYKTEDPKELYDIYSKTPTKGLVMATAGIPVPQLARQNSLFTPCVEKSFPGIEAVYTDLPYNIIMQKPRNVSIIYGFTNKEGFYLVIEETEESFKGLNKKLYDFSDLEFSTQSEANDVSKRVREFYLGDKPASNETFENLSQLFGDIYFEVPITLESELMVHKIDAPIYNYYFKYSGERNLVKNRYKKIRNESGASHGDDILYLFNGLVSPYAIKERDQKVIDYMTRMWTNFAKYGNPTPASDKELPIKWIPSTKEGLNFLYIDEELKLGPIPNPERYNLWKDIYQRYRTAEKK